MTIRGWAALLALVPLSFAAPQQAAAESAAFGTYRFLLEDDALKTLEFEARNDGRGTTTGRMLLVDPSRIPDTDDPEDPRAGDAPAEIWVDVALHDLKAEKNRALMAGIIQDSSHRTYIGSWVQLVVEDSGDNLRIPDQVTWQICRRREGGWIPSDAEVKDDDGAFLRWWATDAELKDDVGIPSVDLLGRDEGCAVHPLFLYTFADLRKAEGDIVVRP
jgi:hypothetical protein